MLGIPCLRASQEDLEWLEKAIGRAPQTPVTVDVEKQEVRFADRVIKATVPDGPRNQLVGGRGTRRRCCSKRRGDRGDGEKAAVRHGVLMPVVGRRGFFRPSSSA